jgi:DNA-directed RNA polymerase specialized sigma24 family protein
MSPVSLRRYRAERLLRREFEALRDRVLSSVRARLRTSRIGLDDGDLEAAYALAWQGLYAVVLDGQVIESPAAWLILVTFRRAVEEHRARCRTGAGLEALQELDSAMARATPGPWAQDDLADGLDTRIRLEQLLEGLSGRLNERERQAATLCYLQGLSRAEAATQMGISAGRMRKLMEGSGAGDPGVSGKVGALARMIEEGTWCDSQGSLMRALAYGILDRDGDRYRLALGHHRRCPSCRAYVVALRGLAAALPPTLLPGARLVLAGLAGGGGVGAGASGAAGASGTGGGLALAGGPIGAKLAVGCLLAVGVGAGCIGLQTQDGPPPKPPGARLARRSTGLIRRQSSPQHRLLARMSESSAHHSAPSSAGAPAVAAAREFGLEPARSPGIGISSRPSAKQVRQGPGQSSPVTATVASARGAGASHAASREFGPG